MIICFLFQICDTIPLVSDMQAISTLNCEYTDDAIYCSKVNDLGLKYSGMRKTRPDGNCFFRAFAFAYLEYLVRNKDDYEIFRELALKSKDKLVKLGFPEFTLEDFHVTVSFQHFYRLHYKLIHQLFFFKIFFFSLWKLLIELNLPMI